MTIEKKLDKEEVWREISLFHKRYALVPSVAILASIFGTSLMTIHRKLDQLEHDGKLVRFGNEYKNHYKLTNQ